MAEAFARGLLDKIMIDVLDVIDRDAEDGKLVYMSRKCNGGLNRDVAVRVYDVVH